MGGICLPLIQYSLRSSSRWSQSRKIISKDSKLERSKLFIFVDNKIIYTISCKFIKVLPEIKNKHNKVATNQCTKINSIPYLHISKRRGKTTLFKIIYKYIKYRGANLAKEVKEY